MAESNWDKEVDVLVVGTGAAALTAAITAKHGGADTLIVESEDVWGGTTSWSGGGLWIPDNSLAKKRGIKDSEEDALHYMNKVIGFEGPSTSPERRKAYVQNAKKAVDFLGEQGVEWFLSKDYPDYYPEEEGGSFGGRALETYAFNTKKLGEWRKTAGGENGGIPLPLRTDDVWLVMRAWASWSGFFRGVNLFFRILGGLFTGKRLRGLGYGLIGHYFHVVIQQGTPVWLSSPLKDLIVEDGKVVGAVVHHGGKDLRIRTKQGVILGAGGFANREEWREKYHQIPGWSSAPTGDKGTAIEIAAKAGAGLEQMDDAWWGASFPDADPQSRHGNFILNERSFPYCILVNQEGKRFVNESASYIDVGHALLRNSNADGAKNLGSESPAVPSWLISDKRNYKKYMYQPNLNNAKGLKAAGVIVDADTLEELAEKIGIPEKNLLETVKRFNDFAKTGKDLDFKRGDSAYDRYYSDPNCKPNPNLGAIEKGPFRALKIVPGDLGTKGGLVTDEHARVLTEDGKVIEGLYASGNTTASVMGDTYPGAGSTIGPATTFGYIAGLHALTRDKS